MSLPSNLKRDPFIGHLLASVANVYGKLGPGLLVDAYRESLAIEISTKGIPFQIRSRLPAYYRGTPLDALNLVPDMTIGNRFIIEICSADSRRMEHIERYMRTYIAVSHLKQGFILNFDAARLANVAQYIAMDGNLIGR